MDQDKLSEWQHSKQHAMRNNRQSLNQSSILNDSLLQGSMNTSIDNPNYNSIDARSKSVMNTQQTYRLRKGSPLGYVKKAEKCSRGVPCSTSRHQQEDNNEEYMMNDKLIMNLRGKLNHGKMRVNPRHLQDML